ncbi:hypothetical protein P3T35_007051 [Kitasatospora sp. GP30]|uniref:DUF2071 domain-containing protein n=1 Tax=Kitasatospora sp. GP30 TaxID=3035084 RepID=UPI000C70B08D|nr:DUF2071 domain-containing protein [Kitasatospora sp. GP30]MDH6145001.1 hypothetical protein [Kitasatospora sp. GP30]
MLQPAMASTVERRLLVNYRVDPDIAARLLPAPLRPKLSHGQAVAGICLIRLGAVRPSWAPWRFGARSENAAHRFAVEWDGPAGVETGVYIPRRDTDSRLNAWAGGRLFPGPHGRADFRTRDTGDTLSLSFTTRDHALRVSVTATTTPELTGSRLFDDLAEAAAFFRAGSRGLSEPARPGPRRADHLDVVTLRTDTWDMAPCQVAAAESSYFDDPAQFPPGSAAVDCALLMRDLPAHWEPQAPFSTATRAIDRPPVG